MSVIRLTATVLTLAIIKPIKLKELQPYIGYSY